MSDTSSAQRSADGSGFGSRAWRAHAQHPQVFRAVSGAVLSLPMVLLYSRSIGDILLTMVAVLFFVRAFILRDWSWLQSTHNRLAVAFWTWLGLCTLIRSNPHAILESLAISRMFLFAAALELWVLSEEAQRRRMGLSVLITASWIMIESWQQYLFGTNIFGAPRWESGVLTGPIDKPRTGGTLQVLSLPAFLPVAMDWLGRHRVAQRVAGGVLLLVVAVTMALIGQRMPMLLFVLGLCIAAVIVRQFRWPIIIALLVLAAGIASTPILSPITYATLVVEFVRRMQDFWDTPYAMLFERAIVIIQAHPWMGLGFDGFRNACMDPQYLKTVSWLPVTNVTTDQGCNIHPHNYWLQIATSAGLPGVVLFVALCCAWFRRIGRGMLTAGRPQQIAIFVTLCTALWPIASTTSLFTVPNAGWFFLLVGWGLAAHQTPVQRADGLHVGASPGA